MGDSADRAILPLPLRPGTVLKERTWYTGPLDDPYAVVERTAYVPDPSPAFPNGRRRVSLREDTFAESLWLYGDDIRSTEAETVEAQAKVLALFLELTGLDLWSFDHHLEAQEIPHEDYRF